MEDLSKAVGAVRIDHRMPTVILLSLWNTGDPADAHPFIRLVGRPNTGLANRCVLVERPLSQPAAEPERLDFPEWGVLLEASVRGTEEEPVIRLLWHDEEGEKLIELADCEVDVESGPRIDPDDDLEIEQREEIVNGVREWIAGWQPGSDIGPPPDSVEEWLEEPDASRIPLADVLGPCDYAPVTHTLASSVEVITLGELIKLSRLRINPEPCSHMRLPHLYAWLTRIAIPDATVGRRLPPPTARETWLAGEDCPECAIVDCLENEGVAF